MKRPETEPFNEPVDWKGLNLPDYPLIVTKPMDLGTVRDKLGNGKYANAEKFATDVRLVFANAMKFNEDGSGIYVVAENLSTQFERRYARITKESTIKKRKQLNNYSTYEQRQNFSTLLQTLTPQELGSIVEVIDKKCPQALNDNFGAPDANDDEIEIEVYNIEGTVLTDLISFVEKVIANRTSKEKTNCNPPPMESTCSHGPNVQMKNKTNSHGEMEARLRALFQHSRDLKSKIQIMRIRLQTLRNLTSMPSDEDKITFINSEHERLQKLKRLKEERHEGNIRLLKLYKSKLDHQRATLKRMKHFVGKYKQMVEL